MVFSSITFVYAFFPLVAVAYYLSKNRVYRNVVLLLASLLFYSWGEPRFLLLMLAATLAAYCGGLLMERSTAHKRLILIVTVVLLVGNLFVFKYLNFFSENLSALFGWSALPKLTLPIGISFYTFQILSYVIDLYRGEIRVQRNYFYLLLYVSFFPQLIAGPIVRYETVEQEILERRESIDDVAAGLRRFILGLAKKVILANNIARIAETIYAGDSAVYGTALYWLAAVAYALQIYFDFSGYSLMALGAAELLGLQLTTNFDTPYFSRSIREFWGRWHISFSSWLKDYVYIPLGGNRKGKARKYLNLLLTFLVSGVWHGVGLTYLIWGALHGVYQIAGDATDRLRGRVYAALHVSRTGRLACAWQCLCTFALVNAAWVFFRAASVHDALYVLTAQFRNVSLTGLLADIRAIAASFNAKSLLSAAFLAFVLLALAGGVLLDCARRFKAPGGDLSARMLSLPLIFRWLLYYALAAFIFAGFLMNNGYFATAANFLYNNF